MANDRGILTRMRLGLDYAMGKDFSYFLALRLPELLLARGEHFCSDLDASRSRTLFARAVRLVEIETHSFCNRQCWFCPNAIVDRRTVKSYLPEAVFVGILADLRSISYRHRISFSRYNEPYGDDIIFRRFEQTRLAVPRAHLEVYSNGDFLTEEKLRQSMALGIDELNIGIYLPNEIAWGPETAERFLQRAMDRMKLKAKNRREAPGERITYVVPYGAMHVSVFCPNYRRDGIDRGGVIQGVPRQPTARTYPCTYPLTDAYIDYNGQMMPCCHLRSDVPAHQDCTFGRVDDRPGSLFRAWTSSVATRWRRNLMAYSAKTGPCAGCQARPWADTRIARTLFRVGLSFAKRCSAGRGRVNESANENIQPCAQEAFDDPISGKV